MGHVCSQFTKSTSLPLCQRLFAWFRGRTKPLPLGTDRYFLRWRGAFYNQSRSNGGTNLSKRRERTSLTSSSHVTSNGDTCNTTCYWFAREQVPAQNHSFYCTPGSILATTSTHKPCTKAYHMQTNTVQRIEKFQQNVVVSQKLTDGADLFQYLLAGAIGLLVLSGAQYPPGTIYSTSIRSTCFCYHNALWSWPDTLSMQLCMQFPTYFQRNVAHVGISGQRSEASDDVCRNIFHFQKSLSDKHISVAFSLISALGTRQLQYQIHNAEISW